MSLPLRLRWSFLACSDPLRDKADWPLTARFDEHRPKCNNKFHHECALGEHKRPTAFVFPLPACALRENRNDMRVVPPTPHVPPSFLLWALRIKEAYSPIIESNAFLMVSTIFSFGP